MLKRPKTLALIAFAALAVSVASSHAATASGPWTLTHGKDIPMSGTPASPVFGDGVTQDSASSFAAAATFAGGTLVAAGDSITLKGSVTFMGANPGAGQFRIGLYDANQQNGSTGWLGYTLANASGTTAGGLYARTQNNNTVAVSTNNTSPNVSTRSLVMHAATDNAVFTDTTTATYNFLLTCTRLANNSLTIEYQLSNAEAGGT